MSASVLEEQLRATFGEGAEDVVKRIWREICRLDKVLPNCALEALREKKWALHSIDEDARIVAKHLPQYKEYVERLEGIAAILEAAARELAERAEGEKRYGLVEIKGKLYPAYMGPVKLSARVEHVPRGEKYVIIEVKYGDRTARVELEVEKYRRSALLHNLAAIATDDARVFYEGYVLHGTASYFQAAERLLMWALFMPGEYKITVRRVYATKDGLSPDIEIKSRFGQGGLTKIENSPIHRLVLRLARELAGRENLLKVKGAANKVLAASWLLVSAILSTPDGGRPSEGLAALAKKGVLPRAALNRLKPIFEELDALLGSVSRADKAYLVGKMVDYDGYIKEGFLRVRAEKIKEMPIELDGVEIRMADVAEAAAKAFSEKGGWSGDELYLGRVEEVPELKVVNIPAFKAMAALIAQKADELRRKELVEYGEPIKFKGCDAEIEITPTKAREESTPIAQLEEIWKGFKDRKYTHLRLVVGGEEYELYNDVEDRSAGRVYVRFKIGGGGARKLEEALKKLGLDVKLTSNGYLFLRYEHLKALLNKGVKAYAVRRAKKGEAMWRVEITYRGVTMALKMSYDERENRLEKMSRTGKIEVFIREEGAVEGKQVELDLGLLAAAGGNCKDCLERRLAEMLNAASEKGFKWSVVGKRVKYLYVYLPSDFKDVVRRFYSE